MYRVKYGTYLDEYDLHLNEYGVYLRPRHATMQPLKIDAFTHAINNIASPLAHGMTLHRTRAHNRSTV